MSKKGCKSPKTALKYFEKVLKAKQNVPFEII